MRRRNIVFALCVAWPIVTVACADAPTPSPLGFSGQPWLEESDPVGATKPPLLIAIDAGGRDAGGRDAGPVGFDASRDADAEVRVLAPFGATCNVHGDCESGYCLATHVCSKPCSRHLDCPHAANAGAEPYEWTCSDVPGLGSRCTCTPSNDHEVCDGRDNNCDTIIDEEGDAKCGGTSPGTVGIALGTSSLDTSEWGTAATFEVNLGVAPIFDVTFDIVVDPPLATVSPTRLTFTSGDFAKKQKVTVSGLDDNGAYDQNVPFVVRLQPGKSRDLRYRGLTVEGVPATRRDDDYMLVTVSSGGTPAAGAGYDPQLSADGRFVAFNSQSDDLAGPTPAFIDVYLRDNRGSTTIASRGTDGALSSNSSDIDAISSDGRFVVFNAYDSSYYNNVFVRDAVANTTKLVSSKTDSGGAAIAPDGSAVAFVSANRDVVPATAGYYAAVMLYWVSTGTVEHISVPKDGATANGGSDNASVSNGGRFVAFTSSASNLVENDTFGTDVFVRDTVAKTTTLISVGRGGVEANGTSGSPRITPDGRFVLFTSTASNLVPDDTNAEVDAFVWDRTTGSIERVNLTSTGGQVTGTTNYAYTYTASISADGRFVAFSTDAKNVVPNDTNGREDVFVRDRQLGTTTRVSLTPQGGQASGASSDPRISADGNFVVFRSTATNLLTDVADGIYRVRRR
jgi:Tol biopolymer transport system component